MDATGMADTSDYASTSYGYTDPISSFFNGIIFIIIFALVIIFIVILMIYRGASWFGSAVTGGATKERFDLGPRPCAEHDECCAHFPAI